MTTSRIIAMNHSRRYHAELDGNISPETDKRAEAANFNARAKSLIKAGWMKSQHFLSLADLKKAVNAAEARKEKADGLQTD